MSTARFLFYSLNGLLLTAAFLALCKLCGSLLPVCNAFCTLVIAFALGAFCRARPPVAAKRDSFWDSPLMYALGGLDYYLFRSLFVHMGSWVVIIQAPAFSGLLLFLAVLAGVPPSLSLYFLILAAFLLGYFWLSLSYIVRVWLAQLCNEELPPNPDLELNESWEERAEAIRTAARERKEESERAREERFVELMTPVLVAVAQADKHFTKDELWVMLDFFQNRLNWHGARLNRAKGLIKAAMSAPRPIAELVQECAQELMHSHRLMLMELVYELVFTKEPPLAAELRLAREMGRKLGLFTTDMRGIEAKYRFREKRQKAQTGGAQEEKQRETRQEKRREEAKQEQHKTRQSWENTRDERRETHSAPSTEAEALAVLGLKPGANAEAIKTAWRRMMVQYHPDKFAHLGPEFIRIAEERTKALNTAYRLLTTKR